MPAVNVARVNVTAPAYNNAIIDLSAYPTAILAVIVDETMVTKPVIASVPLGGTVAQTFAQSAPLISYTCDGRNLIIGNGAGIPATFAVAILYG